MRLPFFGTVLFECQDQNTYSEAAGLCYPCGPHSDEDEILDFYKPICGDNLSTTTEEFLLECFHFGTLTTSECPGSTTSEDELTSSEDEFTTSEDESTSSEDEFTSSEDEATSSEDEFTTRRRPHSPHRRRPHSHRPDQHRQQRCSLGQDQLHDGAGCHPLCYFAVLRDPRANAGLSENGDEAIENGLQTSLALARCVSRCLVSRLTVVVRLSGA